LETRNNSNLLVENENEKELCSLPPFETQSSYFIKWHFTLRFRVNIFMICPF
jgi:hypothetical protein